jgi:uncharacterized membrane protein
MCNRPGATPPKAMSPRPLLLAIPMARVVCAMGAFALQRDWFYVRATVIVLSVLVYSLLGGHP